MCLIPNIRRNALLRSSRILPDQWLIAESITKGSIDSIRLIMDLIRLIGTIRMPYWRHDTCGYRPAWDEVVSIRGSGRTVSAMVLQYWYS
jgi:hypothetical protein